MASEPRKRGAFIVLEGLDRSGKTTQVKLLEQRFIEAGRPAKTMRFPDRSTVIGKMIDGYLKSDVEVEDHVIHLLFSANRWEAAHSIERLLNEGTTIVCDRYYHSGIVYSYAKSNPSMPLSWLTAPESGLPRPDAVLFLDLTPEEARARGGWGNEIYEKEEMQKKVGEAFRQLGGVVDGGEIERDEDVVVVDAGGSVEDVSEKIWSVVAGALNAVERGEKGGVRTVP
ncbi:putative thymidylate kinase [Emericellopsis atlantica]|uniref:Thymidylate kinase n=1 Tax=Emericellopsis atlantica TaxID=2614577 RepID=A0A9P7ZIJ1_9HYPO|nr:putative thymidylate kinase [Emericellopsis atlantica]KAG9252215.1 putative thymidylate kinase [Emericellopsis atlantica]